MERLKTAVIGAGKVAHLHAAALKALPESEFIGVCSPPGPKRDAFAALYGVAAFDTVEQALARGVQAVLVCTPHPEHAAPAVAAARAGVHVLVEKPFASSLADCDAMIEAARAGRAVLGTVSQRRFYPPCRRIHDAIGAGKLGRPMLGTALILGWRDEGYYRSDPWRGSWAKEGGGVLVNQSPHQLDLLLWYLGEAEEVFGYWANINHPYIEVEDTAVATVKFRSGALGSIVVSNSQNPAIHARVSVHGSNGASVGVQTDGGAMFVPGLTPVGEPPFNDIWTIPGEGATLPEWKEEDAALFRSCDPMTHFHALQIRDFLRAALEGREPAVTAQDGRRTVELFTALYQANASGRPVKLPLPARP
jgi:predicted dehydrogenase